MRDFIASGLREHGYLVQEAWTLDETLSQARAGDFDLWVLDRRMPGGDGVQALRELRAEGRATPALFLTASKSLEQRVEGFDAGADGYLAKPFSIVELCARVRALLRRVPALKETTIKRGEIELRLDARRVFVNAREVRVTAHEWRALVMLAQRPGVVFTRAQIMQHVGTGDDAGEAAIDHLLSRLRQKLREAGAEEVFRTVRGQGFAWSSD